jgi:hypothetical protein
VNEKTGVLRDRTYCRFELGDLSHEWIAEDPSFLQPLFAVQGLPGFVEDRGKIAVYVSNKDDLAEVYVQPSVMEALVDLGAMLVFR